VSIWNTPNRAVFRVKMVGSFVFERLWDYDGDGGSRPALFGHFDLARDFGVVDELASSTLVRPVLVQ